MNGADLEDLAELEERQHDRPLGRRPAALVDPSQEKQKLCLLAAWTTRYSV